MLSKFACWSLEFFIYFFTETALHTFSISICPEMESGIDIGIFHFIYDVCGPQKGSFPPEDGRYMLILPGNGDSGNAYTYDRNGTGRGDYRRQKAPRVCG